MSCRHPPRRSPQDSSTSNANLAATAGKRFERRVSAMTLIFYLVYVVSIEGFEKLLCRSTIKFWVPRLDAQKKPVV